MYKIVIYLVVIAVYLSACQSKRRLLLLESNKDIYPKSVIPIKGSPQSKFYSAFTKPYYDGKDSFLIGYTLTPKSKNLIVLGIHDSFYMNTPIISYKVHKVNDSIGSHQATLKFDDNYYSIKLLNDTLLSVDLLDSRAVKSAELRYVSNIKHLDFKFLDYDNTFVDLETILSKEKENVLIFWSTTCESCLRLFRVLSKAQYLNDKNIIFIHDSNNIKNSLKYYNQYKSSFKFLLAAESDIRYFDVNGTPYEVMIDQLGNIKYDNRYIFK